MPQTTGKYVFLKFLTCLLTERLKHMTISHTCSLLLTSLEEESVPENHDKMEAEKHSL